MFAGPGDGGRGNRALVIGAGLTALWLVMLLVFWLTSSGTAAGAPRWISVVAALMPLGLIWMAVGIARAIDTLRAEADTLRAQLDRERLMAEPPRRMSSAGADTTPAPATPASRAPIPAAPRPAAAPRTMPAPRRTEPTAATDPRQTSLGLDAPEPLELPGETVILALNFPDGPDDTAAIAALREALRDPDQARLIRSAQDVVTLLAERGIITDELQPDPTDPAAWRRFGDGQRGRAVGDVGAIRDPAALEAATAAMRADEVFRDAVHHFLRLFDRNITELMPQLSDDEILWLAETRSARAFMLLARAAGLFGQDQ
ncbi:hypothetical protein [Paracoccus xiamenensis]|uniref:hypothetical protein n=1 Tax=Paracoccus xiamenensis TaxID=2714901 RepID=UPI00140DA320|nr:hypothetical protein [Paracoccus xiamenensis]NHF73623.1 hypothetical protein [Paracoccus xiamenensis]